MKKGFENRHKVTGTMALQNTVVNSLVMSSSGQTHFPKQYLMSVHDGKFHPKLTFFSNKAWFYLNGHGEHTKSDSGVQKIHSMM
jgi:hypothetical protein